MSILHSLRGTGSRRAVDKVVELRDENRRLLTIVARSDDTFAFLNQRCADAEEKVVQLDADVFELTTERDQLRAEVQALRAELANRDAVTVPPMERDTTDGADQATAPIDVRPLREAAELGLLTPTVRISSSGASADPGRIPAA